MKSILAKDENNNIKEYKVILTYHSPEYNKDYIVYTDNKYTNDELNIYINTYDKENLELVSEPIDNKEEQTKIKTIINSILLTMKNESEKLEEKS